MEIYGWGRYPKINAQVTFPLSFTECTNAISFSAGWIARGLGRSYGDSSMAPHVLEIKYLDHLFDFDSNTGILTCSAGISLDEILRVFVPRGWFLPVTPGTKFVTIGGAIASDVHGKNHHIDGTLTEHVQTIELLLGNGERVMASALMHPELFRATCGGMGLTGIILSASIKLRRIKSSDILQTTIKAPCLELALEQFEVNSTSTYSVAWVDCSARGRHLGRSVLMLGEHVEEGPLRPTNRKTICVPVEMPSQLLNQYSVKLFNILYYAMAGQSSQRRQIPFEVFFYPLDKLTNWNRLYGKRGILQYQCVVPKSVGLDGLRDILRCIADSGKASPLAVLKVFGKANHNVLSFPVEGYTLALDFKAEPAVFDLLNKLDKLVLKYDGRLYLAKDARMSEITFKTSYSRWEEFEQTREQYHAIGKFSSIQSKRLGLG